MKPRFVITVLVILALAVPATILAQQSKAEKEVRATIEEMRQAPLKGGTEGALMAEKYNADDVVRIPGTGAINTKAEILDGYRAGKLKVESFDFSDVKIRIYGKTAVVTGIESGKGTYLGTPWTGAYRWSRVLVKLDGMWKCVLYQDTPIKQ
jgi:ketosteroid isomerase-like protein